MKIYAIHRSTTFNTTYNIGLFKSKKAAQASLEVINEDYENWVSMQEKLKPYSDAYISFICDNPMPYRYFLEELNTLDK